MLTRFDHIGLSVADLPRAEAFYSGCFGFSRQLEFELAPHPIRGVMLTHPSGMRLELFAHADSEPSDVQGRAPIAAHAIRGYNHFAVCAEDIAPLYEAALAAGAGAVIAPAPSPEPGVRFAFLSDPEGNLVELVERA